MTFSLCTNIFFSSAFPQLIIILRLTVRDPKSVTSNLINTLSQTCLRFRLKQPNIGINIHIAHASNQTKKRKRSDFFQKEQVMIHGVIYWHAPLVHSEWWGCLHQYSSSAAISEMRWVILPKIFCGIILWPTWYLDRTKVIYTNNQKRKAFNRVIIFYSIVGLLKIVFFFLW